MCAPSLPPASSHGGITYWAVFRHFSCFSASLTFLIHTGQITFDRPSHPCTNSQSVRRSPRLGATFAPQRTCGVQPSLQDCGCRKCHLFIFVSFLFVRRRLRTRCHSSCPVSFWMQRLKNSSRCALSSCAFDSRRMPCYRFGSLCSSMRPRSDRKPCWDIH